MRSTWLLAVVIACLAPAEAMADQPAKLIDSQVAVARNQRSMPLAVALQSGVSAEAAVARFLHIAGERGAHYASTLEWVWVSAHAGQGLECRAPIGFRYAAYPPTAQRWQVQVGREDCRPVHPRTRPRSEIRGQVYYRQAPRRMSRREIGQLARQLEPENQARPTRRERRRRRRQMRRMMRLLE